MRILKDDFKALDAISFAITENYSFRITKTAITAFGAIEAEFQVRKVTPDTFGSIKTLIYMSGLAYNEV